MAYQVFFDNFFYSQALGAIKWDAASTFTSSSPRRSNTNSALNIYKTISASDYVTAGLAVYPTNQDASILEFRNGSTVLCGVWWNANKTLSVYAGNKVTLLGTSTYTLPGPSFWNYLEMGVYRHASAGTIELRINGSQTPILSLSGVNTGASSIDKVRVMAAGYCTDVYIAYGSEIIFLGDCKVETLLPSANATPQDFTPTSGLAANAYSLLRTDDYAGGITSSTVGHISRFELDNLATYPVNIYGVDVMTFAKKDTPGTRSIKTLFKSGTTETKSPERVLSSNTYGYWESYQLDPHTSAAWTPEAIDALQVGVEVTA